MNIVGLQKMTLLDYPGKVACTVFLGGCNFRCPFCHNSELLEANTPSYMEPEALLAFLQKRQGILDGVCITGGEPTLQKDLPQLLRSIKALGYPIKLDTNGCRPQMLRQLVSDGLVDYVAMDIKNSPERYGLTVGLEKPDLRATEESIRFLLSGAVDYELRTTVVLPLHTEASVSQMGQWLYSLNGGEKIPLLYLQPFVDRDTVPVAGLSAPDASELDTFVSKLTPFVAFVKVRGI